MQLSSEKSLHFSKRIREGGAKSPSLNFQPIIFRNNQLKILDQTKLPGRIRYLNIKNYREVAKAIKTLQVRGAPLIGVTAAFGLALEAQNYPKSSRELLKHLNHVAKVLKQARPTAVNLSWAIERCIKKIESVPLTAIRKKVREEAEKIYTEETAHSFALGEIGVKLVKKNARILTICNAGKLAAPGLGTALAIIYIAFARKKNPLVYVCETRPLLQGARLTAFELTQAGISTILITDNMVGTVASQVDLFLVGADRIAANGDTANKIGTFTLSIIAQYFKVPFYVVAPISTFDLTKPNGKSIPIEIRNSKEVVTIQNHRIAPKDVMVYNPAFDITPGALITGFITDRGIIYPPFHKSIKRVLGQ
jgi:methylthioribose-1-phosphate isomerase